MSLRRAGLVFGPAGVAAVDHGVVAVEQLGEPVDGVLGDLAGGQHHPHDPRRRQSFDERGKRRHADGPGGRRPLDGGAVGVEHDHLVSGVTEDAVRHAAAHAPHPDEPDLTHDDSSSGVGFRHTRT